MFSFIQLLRMFVSPQWNPRQNDGPLNYFMYPYAEVNGKSLEWLAAQTDLKFKVKFKAH